MTITEQQMAEAVEAMARAYDKEYAAQRGEPDPWTIEDIEGDADAEREWQSERLACAQAALTAALPIIERAVRADYEANLADPVFVRLNMLRGGIARPDDLVWLHDTNGPVAAKVRDAECEIWLAAAERAESRMDACDVLALTTSSEQTIVEARIRESAYRVVAEEFRALAEEARG